MSNRFRWFLIGLLIVGQAGVLFAQESPLLRQSQKKVDAQNVGCLGCHEGVEPIHASLAVRMSCVACHGGDSGPRRDPAILPGSPAYEQIKQRAHILPKHPEKWAGKDGKYSAANPERSYTLLNEESQEFIRFVNPGDLRVAEQTCGPCHQSHVNRVKKSTMATSSIFWGAAAYANGVVSNKRSIFGEAYGPDGLPQAIQPVTQLDGSLPFLLPLPRWQITQPGDIFRAFERGGIFQNPSFPDVGNPNFLEEAGKPDIRLSNRGLGTGLRVSASLINLQKTRLNDPHLSFLGTNDHPGDYRSSGCSSCHLVYANDRDPIHSSAYAPFGNLGESATGDPTIRRKEPGHPIRHQFTRAIPTSQCMSCHMHQPNSFVNTYLGYTMWDYETDGAALWPKTQKNPTEAERLASLDLNPEGAAMRGLWGDRDFLAKVSELNPTLTQTQFADYHGHGWIFRSVLKRDRKGNMLDKDGKVVDFADPDRFGKAVHLKDIHLERGMHCVDCHFSVDNHGTGKIEGEYSDAIEIGCADCHGTTQKKATLITSGPAAPKGGTALDLGQTPFGRAKFLWREEPGVLLQRSMVSEGVEWIVPQVIDSITPEHPRYNAKADRAKTLKKDWTAWRTGTPPNDLAHQDEKMTCFACHSSWVTSCFGCHLPMESNFKADSKHFEGETSRNYTSYNPQVIRDDIYMLGIRDVGRGAQIAPVRSSSALTLSSTVSTRSRVYIQQPPISAPGYSSQAFNTHVPHTVRKTETKGCADCHLSQENDNNAWMAQLLTLGTNFVNFIGRFAWVAEGGAGLEAVAVTEWDEPQAVFGSFLHKLAYPDNYKKHQARALKLTEAYHHAVSQGKSETLGLTVRGEYLYAAQGSEGLEIFDIANIDNKDFSERIVTAPVSSAGQRTFVRSRYATAVLLPTNMPIAPFRHSPPENQEQPWHPIYHYAFIADREEGIILVNVDTLADRDPANNFLTRALTFNPDGIFKGARALALAGNYLYVAADAGMIVVDFNQPLSPKVVAKVTSLDRPAAIAIQFRYAFVTTETGLSVVDITHPTDPKVTASLPIPWPKMASRNIYVARTYAYLAAGASGLIIVDVERPEQPFIDQTYMAEGRLNDVRDIKVAATNASLFAYVADGRNGLRVLQLTSPERTPGYLGFSPRPAPALVAAYPTRGPAVGIAKGLDRDRAVDESGNQVSVFNRLGARPFTLAEMQKLYLKNGEVYTVEDSPKAAPISGAPTVSSRETILK